VREIVRYASLSPIPGAPRTVEGALNLRGEVIPVVNVPRALGLGDVELDRKTAIVVAHVHQCSLGLVVDRVVDVATFEQSLIDEGAGGLMDSRFVQGMARSGARFVQILDLDSFASPSEIAQFVARASEVPKVAETAPTSGAHS
jgi:purine-binding chemotaxis protein CheW